MPGSDLFLRPGLSPATDVELYESAALGGTGPTAVRYVAPAVLVALAIPETVVAVAAVAVVVEIGDVEEEARPAVPNTSAQVAAPSLGADGGHAAPVVFVVLATLDAVAMVARATVVVEFGDVEEQAQPVTASTTSQVSTPTIHTEATHIIGRANQ